MQDRHGRKPGLPRQCGRSRRRHRPPGRGRGGSI